MFKVASEQCPQCLFSKNRIVSGERMKEIVESCHKNGNHFICHKTEDICCRGFYDTQDTQIIQIANRLNMIEFVKAE